MGKNDALNVLRIGGVRAIVAVIINSGNAVVPEDAIRSARLFAGALSTGARLAAIHAETNVLEVSK